MLCTLSLVFKDKQPARAAYAAANLPIAVSTDDITA